MPNATVPPAVTGLPSSITRRAAIGGAAVAATLGPVLAFPARGAGTTADLDADLFAAIDRWKMAHRTYLDHVPICTAAEETYFAMRQPNVTTPWPADILEEYSKMRICDVSEGTPRVNAFLAERKAAEEAVILENNSAAFKSGHMDAEYHSNKLLARADKLGLAAANIRAKTLAGILAKMAMIESLGIETEPEGWEAVSADLQGMADAGPAAPVGDLVAAVSLRG